jgi:hypothetical protein
MISQPLPSGKPMSLTTMSKRLFLEVTDRRVDGVRRGDFIAAPHEQAREQRESVLMILNEEDARVVIAPRRSVTNDRRPSQRLEHGFLRARQARIVRQP